MNCFAPLMTQSPLSCVARVRALPASEPASGSVRPKAPSLVPAVSCGIQACFCSSEPKA